MSTNCSERNIFEDLRQECASIRNEIIRVLHNAGGGHYGGCLSVVEILAALYHSAVCFDSGDLNCNTRDRVVLSKGHACVALYVVLCRLGFFHKAELARYGQVGGILEGHPDMLRIPGIDFSTGSLGQGLSAGAGMAIALKDQGSHVWVVLGDGECQEGQVWETAMLAARYRLHHLHAIVDSNGFQEYGWNTSLYGGVPVPNLKDKWQSFGWSVIECDGHDIPALRSAMQSAINNTQKPTVLIADTVKGKGFELIESNPDRFHCGSLTDSEYKDIATEEAN